MPKDLKEEMKKLRDRAYEKSMKKKGVKKFGDDEYFIPVKLPGMKKGGLSHGDVGGAFGKVYKGKAKDYKSVVPITPPAPKPEPDKKKHGGQMKQKPKKYFMGALAMGALGALAAKKLFDGKKKDTSSVMSQITDPTNPTKVVEQKKMGGLTGGRKKLDVNKDGKISGEDFKILRGKQNKMKGGGCAIKGTKFKGVF